ncbi:MAG: cytochrome c biogenesis protein CcsA [Sutterella wadsworthensis]|nr:cytochrome c biogenesis protein CcsA [Sutterella wadsworthensis]
MSTSITLEGFYRKAGKLIPWFMSAALVLFVVGVYLGFFVCPIEARQGNSYRIIFIHIPAAWLAMSLYLLMAVASIVGLLKNSRLAFILAQAMAPTGALMGFIALFSGAFWGRPTWGTYWVWDARLTSMLILFFLYLGFIALHSAIDDKRRADQAASVISIVGAVNVVASGGVSTLDDLRTLRELTGIGVEGAIVGKALYSGQFTIEQALAVASGRA